MKSCWKKAHNRLSKDSTPIYANHKKHLWIVRSGKQLGKSDNYTKEKYPVIVQSTSGAEIHTAWFDDKKSANKYMNKYMKENC